MESSNYFIMVTTDWHQVACIAYFVTSDYTFSDENYSQ